MDKNEMEILKILLQSILIIIGWIVVHNLTATRENIKARKDLLIKSIDAIITDITKLHKAAIEYHSAERDKAKENALKMELQDISMRVTELKKLYKPTTGNKLIDKHTIDLKRKITGTHFEDEHVAKLEANAQQIQEITFASLKTNQALTTLRNNQYV